METNGLIACASAGEMLSLGLAIFVLFRSGFASKFPSLVASLTLELATDVAFTCILARPGHYVPYFYAYWITTAVQSLLRLWIIADIVRSMPGIGFLPRSIHLFVGTVGAAISGASAAYCFHSAAGKVQDAISAIVLVDQFVNLAWVIFFGLFIAAIFLLGWSSASAYIANGMAIRIFSTAVTGEFALHQSHQVRIWANVLNSACTIAVFLFWSYKINRTSLAPDPEPEGDTYATQSSLEDLLAIRSGRER